MVLTLRLFGTAHSVVQKTIWEWKYQVNFFEWSHSSNQEESERFQKNLEENIRSMMELMKQDYTDIMIMPYKFFIDTIKWKFDLEEEKRKKMEESTRRKK